MEEISGLSRKALILPLLALLVNRADAQTQQSTTSPQELYKTIAALDTALFDSYNRCDLEKFSAFFADNLELYHSRDGLILGKEKLTASIKENICGGDVRRQLVAGTLHVYRMDGYGALEIGSTSGNTLAIQRWRLEGRAGDLLRPPRSRQVAPRWGMTFSVITFAGIDP